MRFSNMSNTMQKSILVGTKGRKMSVLEGMMQYSLQNCNSFHCICLNQTISVNIFVILWVDLVLLYLWNVHGNRNIRPVASECVDDFFLALYFFGVLYSRYFSKLMKIYY